MIAVAFLPLYCSVMCEAVQRSSSVHSISLSCSSTIFKSQLQVFSVRENVMSTESPFGSTSLPMMSSSQSSEWLGVT